MRSWPEIDAYLTTGAILWFGELHGTEQSPRFVGDVASHAAQRGRVQLGLEMPRDLQPQLNAYLRGDGGPVARASLLEGAFWQWRDGRGSEAMVALIERVRVLNTSEQVIEIVAFDIRSDDAISDAYARDAAMAERLMRARDPAALLVVLSGNVHSRRRRGVPWDDAFVPAAAHLVERGLPVTTFDVAPAGGTYWGIVGDASAPRCGIHPIAVDVAAGEPWTLGPARDDTHHAIYRIGFTVASLPAQPSNGRSTL